MIEDIDPARAAQGGPAEPSEAGRSAREGGEGPGSARRGRRGLFDHQKRAAAEQLRSVAGVMRDTAGRFEQKEEEAVADYVRKAADVVEHCSSSLRDRKVEELVSQAEDAIRHRPALILGLATAAGFALGRILRAGSLRGNGSPRAAAGSAEDLTD